jgi:hypothetical protein
MDSHLVVDKWDLLIDDGQVKSIAQKEPTTIWNRILSNLFWIIDLLRFVIRNLKVTCNTT